MDELLERIASGQTTEADAQAIEGKIKKLERQLQNARQGRQLLRSRLDKIAFIIYGDSPVDGRYDEIVKVMSDWPPF